MYEKGVNAMQTAKTLLSYIIELMEKSIARVICSERVTAAEFVSRENPFREELKLFCQALACARLR